VVAGASEVHPECEKASVWTSSRVVQHTAQPSFVLVIAANGVERRVGIPPLEVGLVLGYRRAGDSLLARDRGNVLERLPQLLRFLPRRVQLAAAPLVLPCRGGEACEETGATGEL
jgi:hypothetical protein